MYFNLFIAAAVSVTLLHFQFTTAGLYLNKDFESPVSALRSNIQSVMIVVASIASLGDATA